MPGKTRFDIQSENFDIFFRELIQNMTEEQKSVLPKDVQFKIFKSSGKINTKNTSNLNFLAKAFVLWKSMGVEFTIVAKSKKEDGVDPEEFLKYQKLVTDRTKDMDDMGVMVSNGVFVLGSKDLADTFSFLNNRSTSPAYKLLVKAKIHLLPRCLFTRIMWSIFPGFWSTMKG